MGSIHMYMGVLAVFAILAPLVIVVHADCDSNGKWSKPLYDLLAMQHDALSHTNIIFEPTPDLIKEYSDLLKSFPENAKAFMDADLKEPVLNNDCFPMLVQTIAYKSTMDWAWSYLIGGNQKLFINFVDRYIKAERRIKERIDAYDKSTSDSTTAFVLPVEGICNEVPSRTFQKKISIKDVCPDINTCAPSAFPYGPGIPGREKPFTDSCTNDDKCNLKEALPLMAGVYWMAVNDWMVEKLCPAACEGGECNIKETYEKLVEESKLLMAYVNIHPNIWGPAWEHFFDGALRNNAFLNVRESVAMIDEELDFFDTTPTICSDLLYTDACVYADIYKEYIMIKKVQNYRKDPGLIRDFRHLPDSDFKTRLRQERDTLNHLQLLGTIKALDENLEASVSGISTHFQTLAAYDEGIADADIAFIQGELTKFESKLSNVEGEVTRSLSNLLDKTIVLVGAVVVEKTALAAAKIVENANPLKLFFGGVDVTDILELGGEIADAATGVVKASALLRNFFTLVEDSVNIKEAFTGNKKQLEGLKELVEKIREGSTQDIDQHADVFLKAYAGYTPQTDRSALAENNGLWSAFGGAACDLVNGETGIGSSIPKGIVANQLLCEKFQGALAQFFTLRDDIFDFQFQLVDAVAAVVRGNIAKRLAEGIKGKGDVLHATQLLIGSFKMHNKFQSTASLACDVLEYQLQGEQDNRACATNNGLFTKENLDALIDHSFTASTTENTKDVYIPTRPSFKGDTGYIDLQAMAKGQTIVFKLPTKATWLRENGWITSDQTDMPFVKDIKLFLPQKEYKTGSERQETTTTIELSSIAGSHVSLASSKKNIAYILPKRHNIFQSEYKEGYTTCSATEIDNPYSLCGNLPKICQTTTRAPGSLVLYPTILSTWSLAYTIEQGSTQLDWNAPKPALALNLLIHAKVTLIPSIQPQKDQTGTTKRSEVDTVTSEDGCCDGNRYRISRFNNKCAECPVNSQSKLRGYYCELNEEEEAPSRSDKGKRRHHKKHKIKKRKH